MASISVLPVETVTAIARHMPPKDLLNFRLTNVWLARKSFDAFTEEFATEFEWSNKKRKSIRRMLLLEKEELSHIGIRVKRLKVYSRGPSFVNPVTKECNLSHLQNLREFHIQCMYDFTGPFPFIDWWLKAMHFPRLKVAKLVFPYIKDCTAFIDFVNTHKSTLDVLDLKGITFDYAYGGWREALQATKALKQDCKLLISTPWAMSSCLPTFEQFGYHTRVDVDIRLSPNSPYASQVQVIKDKRRRTYFQLNPGDTPEAVDAMIAAHKFPITREEDDNLTEFWADPFPYESREGFYYEEDSDNDEEIFDYEEFLSNFTQTCSKSESVKGEHGFDNVDTIVRNQSLVIS